MNKGEGQKAPCMILFVEQHRDTLSVYDDGMEFLLKFTRQLGTCLQLDRVQNYTISEL